MTDSVHYPIARDKESRWVSITDAVRTSEYYCPECGSQFVVRLGTVRKHHFAHRPGYSGECTGESGYHHLAKHLLAYQFERYGRISLTYVCPRCKRTAALEKKISEVQVEKGDKEYRPDVRLILEGGEKIDCEIVHRNPLGDKFRKYQERRANLLVWDIGGQVSEVPTLVQEDWDNLIEISSASPKGNIGDCLHLFSSLLIENHDCQPYGIAYVCETDCYKCGLKTKVALLSFWYPTWGEDNWGSGGTAFDGGHIETREYILSSSIPKAFVQRLNQQCGTCLSNDHSYTTGEYYVMNHCARCGAKIGDYYLFEIFVDSAAKQKVVVEFDLTPWEVQRVRKLIYT